MSNLVPRTEIEAIVGADRHETRHLGRAVSDEETFYILHSHQCLNTGNDLRDCGFSLALDKGVKFPVEDEVLILGIYGDYLVAFKELE